MRFVEIAWFELTYQLRRAWPWLTIVMLTALVFLFMRDGSFSEALYTEFYINSPFKVAMATVFGNLLWLLAAAFITGEAASRDIASRMQALIYTSSVNRIDYLGGRFLAAFVLHACILLTVQLTILLSIYLPGVHPGSIGPFRPAAFINAYLFIALPNAFAATALQFAFSLWSGKPITAYMASLLLFFIAFFIAGLILFRSGLGTLLDPIGVRFIWDELSHLWTTVEKSHRLLELKGPLLQNRMIWMSFGVVTIMLTYVSFQFKHRVQRDFRFKISGFRFWKRPDPVMNADHSGQNFKLQISHFKSGFSFRFHVLQVLTITCTSFRAIATSWVGLAMLFFIPLLAIPVVIDQMVAMSVPLVPTTTLVVKELTGPLSADMSRWMVVPGLIIFFVGELVWRERDNGLGEITDAMPGSEWAPLLGKFLGMSLLLIAFMSSLTLAGMVAQLIMDYDHFEPGLYLKVMFGLQLPDYLLFAALSICVHSVVNQKYVGHLVAIVAYAFIAAIATMLGIEHNLLIFGAGPVWSYTEMSGFGNSVEAWFWFKLYWAAWAWLLMVVAALFWSRGKETDFRFRLQNARRRLTTQTLTVGAAAMILILCLGGFIFYNTNVLNHYSNSEDIINWQAQYERRYGQYETAPKPQVSRTQLHVELYPSQRRVEIKGTYRLVNNSGVTIDSLHISVPTGAYMDSLTFDHGATLALDDKEFFYRIYSLTSPLKPGDSLELNFNVHAEPRGFKNNGVGPSLSEAGSYFTNQNLCPSIGFQRERTIINTAQRREYGLEPRAVMASLYEAHEGDAPSLDAGTSFEATIGTSKDQMAVAPGILQRSWSQGERNYFHYVTSKPIGSVWAFFSAEYEVYKKDWHSPNGPVTVQIFHHRSHTAHLEHMMHGVLSSLAYYSKTFGPYRYTHLTLAEHPFAPGTGMHAEPSFIYYGQGYPYWLPKNENRLDFPYAVMGHEMAHQWTLPLAMVEGLPFMSEGLAWYYGIMMVNETRGAEQTNPLLSFLRQPYPHQPIRRGEPLLRALDPYLSYRRGPFALYALTQYVGKEQVNGALRKLVGRDSVGVPLITTLDLYRELQTVTPDSMKYLLRDLFEVNTLWQLDTKKATAVRTSEREWKITLTVDAKKIVYDSAGVETEIKMNELIPIGVFGERQPGRTELSSTLYLQKHRIRSGEQTIVISVSAKPVLAGVDPFHILDWEEKEDDNNIQALGTGVPDMKEGNQQPGR